MSYDNILKYLVEQFPYDFAKWLVNATEDEELTILKTELSIEPITTDGLVFMKIGNQILHLEFQTLPYSDPPMPLIMLDYWVRLRKKYNYKITQVVIFLKETSYELVFIDEFREENTIHRYQVIRMWEMNPELFLDNGGLLPLAALAKSTQPRNLLAQVSDKVDTIKDKAMQSSISACVQLLAGIRHDNDFIKALFREEIMKESVVYQSIVQEAQEEVRIQDASLVINMLNHRLGSINPELEEQIKGLSFPKLRELALALLDWNSQNDLIQWLNSQS